MKHETQPETPISDDVVRKIADDAAADERSVWKRLGGGRLRPKTERRIDAAIAANLIRRQA